MDSTNASSAPDRMPGTIIGNVTRRNVVHESAPRSRAASSIDGSSVSTRARTTIATNDSENITWAMRIVRYPSGVLKIVNSDSSDAPNTISGAEMTANSSRLNEPWPRNRYLPSAMPIIVPRIVVISVVSIAITSDVISACVRSSNANSLLDQYFVVKPTHVVL